MGRTDVFQMSDQMQRIEAAGWRQFERNCCCCAPPQHGPLSSAQQSAGLAEPIGCSQRTWGSGYERHERRCSLILSLTVRPALRSQRKRGLHTIEHSAETRGPALVRPLARAASPCPPRPVPAPCARRCTSEQDRVQPHFCGGGEPGDGGQSRCCPARARPGRVHRLCRQRQRRLSRASPGRRGQRRGGGLGGSALTVAAQPACPQWQRRGRGRGPGPGPPAPAGTPAAAGLG